jgi:hypothetical protein
MVAAAWLPSIAATVLLAGDSSQGTVRPLLPGLVVPACADRVSPDNESAETRAEAEGTRSLRLRLLQLLLEWLAEAPAASLGTERCCFSC